MRVEGIIFDLDGTLTNTSSLSMSAYHYAFKQVLGREFSDYEIKSNFGPSEDGVIKRISPDKWQDCFRAYLDYEMRHLDSVRVYSEIETALSLLKQRQVLLAIATGRSERSCSTVLKSTNLLDYFEIVETNAPENKTKQPVIQRVIDKWSVSAERVAYIGDTVSDIKVTQSIGILPLWAVWSTSTVPDIKRFPDVARFYEVNEFINWIYKNIN